MSDQRICPRSPHSLLVGRVCDGYGCKGYHNHAHNHSDSCDSKTNGCPACIPYPPSHSSDCAVAVNGRHECSCMPESDTPITDAADLYDYQTAVETCRKLELYLAAASAEVERQHKLMTKCDEEATAWCIKEGKARAEADRRTRELNISLKEQMRLRAEVERLREALKRLEDGLHDIGEYGYESVAHAALAARSGEANTGVQVRAGSPSIGSDGSGGH